MEKNINSILFRPIGEGNINGETSKQEAERKFEENFKKAKLMIRSQLSKKILSEEEIGDFYGIDPLNVIKWLNENEKRFTMIQKQAKEGIINENLFDFLNEILNEDLLYLLEQKDPSSAIKWLNNNFTIQNDFLNNNIGENEVMQKLEKISKELITSKIRGKTFGVIGKLIENPYNQSYE